MDHDFYGSQDWRDPQALCFFDQKEAGGFLGGVRQGLGWRSRHADGHRYGYANGRSRQSDGGSGHDSQARPLIGFLA